eukprot:6213578-Pleurochrysis_carterae.AAC.2
MSTRLSDSASDAWCSRYSWMPRMPATMLSVARLIAYAEVLEPLRPLPRNVTLRCVLYSAL